MLIQNRMYSFPFFNDWYHTRKYERIKALRKEHMIIKGKKTKKRKNPKECKNNDNEDTKITIKIITKTVQTTYKPRQIYTFYLHISIGSMCN